MLDKAKRERVGSTSEFLWRPHSWFDSRKRTPKMWNLCFESPPRSRSEKCWRETQACGMPGLSVETSTIYFATRFLSLSIGEKQLMADDDSIIVEPVPDGDGAGNWVPTVGPEAVEFLQSVVTQASRDSVRDAAISILAKGTPPTAAEGQQTGLVIGYVQGGKTMSFETVAALASDNGFQMVIVVAGTSNPLLDQSTGRLQRDLRLDVPGRERRWIQFENPDDDDATVQAIRDVLDDWRDAGTPEEFKKTVLITVLKNHRRLQDFGELLRAAGIDQH